MIDIMIVDDESIVREFLRVTIDWESYGFAICGEARNGLEALEMLKAHCPDIMLIDINMPFMDGLQLAEEVKKHYPKISIVIITGYSEFEYARKAIKLGIEDYILKPFEEEDLMKTLVEVKSKITKAEKEQSFIQDNKDLIIDGLLLNVISNEYHLTDEETIGKLEFAGAPFSTLSFQGASIEIDNMYQNWNDVHEMIRWKQALSQVLPEFIKAGANHFVFHGPEDRIISIVELENEDQVESLLKTYSRFADAVKKEFQFTVTIGIGGTYNGLKGIRASYIESLSALKAKFKLGNDKVIPFSKMESKEGNLGFYSSQINEEILLHLRLNEWNPIQSKLKDIFAYIREAHLSIDNTYTICAGLIALCLSHVSEMGRNIKDIYGDGFFPFKEIREKGSLEELHGWLVDVFKKTIHHFSENKMSKSKKILKEAMDYIHHHYPNNELTVEEVSNHVYINSSYLRFLFKKDLGMTVTDYVTNVRMQKAKELLSYGNMKLSKVSEMIGYSDASYFSKCFKKYFGVSPSEYESSVK